MSASACDSFSATFGSRRGVWRPPALSDADRATVAHFAEKWSARYGQRVACLAGQHPDHGTVCALMLDGQPVAYKVGFLVTCYELAEHPERETIAPLLLAHAGRTWPPQPCTAEQLHARVHDTVWDAS